VWQLKATRRNADGEDSFYVQVNAAGLLGNCKLENESFRLTLVKCG
jgi:hypothetical protein